MGRMGRALRLYGLLLTLSTVLALPSAGLAASLYEAVVAVADRSTGARSAALEQALGEVLVRMTGDRSIASGPDGAALLPQAARYVQQYRYEGSESSGLRFRVGFDGAALEAALRAQGVAMWGRDRPPLLLWLAADDGARRYLLASDPNDALYNAVQAAAQQRGLNVILPLLDLEDQAKVSYSDVWGGFQERVVAASARYQSQVVLTARVQRLGSAAWTSRWTLRMAGQDSSWQSGGPDLQALLDDGLGQAAQRLAAQLVIPATGLSADALPVVIEDVDTLADYAALENYLTSLAPVRAVQLVSAQGRRLVYQVEVQGGAPALEQATRMGGLLWRVEGPAPAQDTAAAAVQPSYYRLRH